MTWATPITWTTGDIITAAKLNVTRDDLNETAAAKATAAGEVPYASAANTIAMLSPAANKVVGWDSTGALVSKVGSLITAFPMDWQSAVAQRYVARFGADTVASNAVYGDLADAGWYIHASATPPVTVFTPRTGDFDAANDGDAGSSFVLTASGNLIASTAVVGTWTMFEMLERLTGVRPTTCTVSVAFRFVATTDGADTSGFGITNDGDALLSVGGGMWITCGATNFEIWTGSAADTGVAKDTALHILDIVITASSLAYSVELDDVVVATGTFANDLWPMMCHAIHGASGGNMELHGFVVAYD